MSWWVEMRRVVGVTLQRLAEIGNVDVGRRVEQETEPIVATADTPLIRRENADATILDVSHIARYERESVRLRCRQQEAVDDRQRTPRFVAACAQERPGLSYNGIHR